VGPTASFTDADFFSHELLDGRDFRLCTNKNMHFFIVELGDVDDLAV